ncbi:MAG: glutamine-hydrolyzing GMP synthase, partial [Flavobacteriales bacterium]|nr:glutamine-hydrolyzing GMP synthase [Flavobacteriales bacterium]
MSKNLLILDFGSQYTQLIARRVRELNVYCEIHPYNKIPDNFNFSAVILSGSPCSVNQNDAPHPKLESFNETMPILGICYGAQYLVKHFGGVVESSNKREYGRANLSFFDIKNPLFDNVKSNSQVWMSHGDTIKNLPSNFNKIASTTDIENAAFYINESNIYGLQFHPEVFHSTDGLQIINNFVVNISHCSTDWTPDSFVDSSISNIKNQVGHQKVVLGLSGGVDSSVAALLLHKAIGDNLHCIFVDNGLLRKNEFEDVLKQYESLGLNIKGVDAKEEFYKSLSG